MNKARAVDVTWATMTSTGVSGSISYASDEDWFSFPYPEDCITGTGPFVAETCALEFTLTGPNSNRLRVVGLMRKEDLSIHESFVYTGTLPQAAPLVFGQVAVDECHECSFADARHVGSGDPHAYRYYLQVRDVGANDWEADAAMTYNIKVTDHALGCPPSCLHFAGASNCACACAAGGACPPVVFSCAPNTVCD